MSATLNDIGRSTMSDAPMKSAGVALVPAVRLAVLMEAAAMEDAPSVSLQLKKKMYREQLDERQAAMHREAELRQRQALTQAMHRLSEEAATDLAATAHIDDDDYATSPACRISQCGMSSLNSSSRLRAGADECGGAERQQQQQHSFDGNESLAFARVFARVSGPPERDAVGRNRDDILLGRT